jgi:hypothetical protein
MSESTLHRSFKGRQIHVPHSFEFANAAQREASGDYVSTDLYKLALQLDDKSLWQLTAVTPTWKEVGVQLPFEATGDLLFRGENGVLVRLPIGADGKVLRVLNGLPVWGSGLPPGAMIDWPSATPPSWGLVMDGAEYDRVDYSALFAVIGTTYGAGDGSTTFNVPNYRNLFRRGVPVGGTVGTYQEDEFKSHTHGMGFSWTINMPQSDIRYGYYFGNQQTEATGGTETRPKNMHSLPIISY